MKKFNFSKGLVIGLLTMALCLTCFGYVRASADAEAGKFNASVKSESASLIEIESIKTGDDEAFVSGTEWTSGTITVTVAAKEVEGKKVTEVKFGDDVIAANPEGKYVKAYPYEDGYAENGLEIIISATAVEVFDITLAAKDADKADAVVDGVTLKNEAGEEDLALTGIAKDTEVKFTVAGIPTGKQVKSVKAGDTALTAADDVYTVKISADTTITVEIWVEPVINAEYMPDTDTVRFTSNKQVTVKYAALKKSKAKISRTSEIALAANTGEDKDLENCAFAGEISLSDANNGVKVAENKDLYLWYGLEDPDKKKETSCNLTVKGNTTKKLLVTINYAKAGVNDTAVSFSVKDGKTEKAVDVAEVVYRYAADGATFPDEWSPANGLTGIVLEEALAAAADGKPTYQFKIKGKAEVAAQEAVDDTPAVPAQAATRGSKLVKVKVSKPGTAPKVKVDFAKGTVAIKNGFDYAVMTASANKPTAADWYTVLPVNKDGKADSDTVQTIGYTPVKKFETAVASSFTKDKIKGKVIVDLVGARDEVYLYVRKSATAKKPASLVSEQIVLKAAAAAPSFTTVTVTGEYSESKKTFSYSLEVPEALADGSYEYLIVKDGQDDLSAAKWTKLGSAIVVDKAKSKISKTVTNVLKADGNFYILIRKAAVKNGDDAAIASNPVKTKVNKAAEDKTAETPTGTISWAPAE